MASHADAGHIGCTDHTTCTATQWEAKAATLNEDRVCLDLTTCAASEWEQTPAGANNDRVCHSTTTCTDTQWESVAVGPTNNRVCTDRGDVVVTVSTAPNAFPQRSVSGNPKSFPYKAWGAGETVTNTFDNVQFFSDSAPVKNLRCGTVNWCFFNGFDMDHDKCVNQGNWGWRFHRPVQRAAFATPTYDGFKAVVAWVYDQDGMVLDKRTVPAGGGRYIAFTASQAVIAKVELRVQDSTGSRFCLSHLWFDGHAAAQQCSHIVCNHEQHTCQHTHVDTHGIVQPHRLSRGACTGTADSGRPLLEPTSPCHKNNECDGTRQHQSIRVRYRMHGWVSPNVAGALEHTCTRNHRCGMGAWSGDKSKCECMQM